ncbi:hypothetical protein HDU91_002646, partial [Kappamyces sp. JEL0680]
MDRTPTQEPEKRPGSSLEMQIALMQACLQTTTKALALLKKGKTNEPQILSCELLRNLQLFKRLGTAKDESTLNWEGCRREYDAIQDHRQELSLLEGLDLSPDREGAGAKPSASLEAASAIARIPMDEIFFEYLVCILNDPTSVDDNGKNIHHNPAVSQRKLEHAKAHPDRREYDYYKFRITAFVTGLLDYTRKKAN